jgi:hypothetical protein
MCVKKDILKRVFVIMNVATRQPQVLCVLPNCALYHQVYEDTKNRPLTRDEFEKMQVPMTELGEWKLVPVDIPRSYLF